MTDEGEFSDEEDGHVEASLMFKSKNGNLTLPENQVRLSIENVINMITRPTEYVVSWINPALKCS